MKPNTEPTARMVTAIEISISLRTFAITRCASASTGFAGSSGTSGAGTRSASLGAAASAGVAAYAARTAFGWYGGSSSASADRSADGSSLYSSAAATGAAGASLASAGVSRSTCLAAANSSASSSASALSASIRDSSGVGSGPGGSAGVAASRGESGWAGSNGRVSSSSDWASSSERRVAGSTGLFDPTVRSKEGYLSFEFMTHNVHTVHVTAAEKGERLDRVLAQRVTDFSRSRLKALILDGAAAIDKTTVRDPAHRVKAGNTIALTVPPDEPAAPAPENIPLDIVYEDDALMLIDKT